jgi:hypothetical protein
VENFLLEMRLFRESRQPEPQGLPYALEELERFRGDSLRYFVAAVKQLIVSDIENANMTIDFEDGTLPALAKRAQEEPLDTPPVARTGHFAYGLLDLVQQHRPKFTEFINVAMYVATTSNHFFLRRKALEVFYTMGGTQASAIDIFQQTKQEMDSDSFMTSWKGIKKRVDERNTFRANFQSITVDYTPYMGQSKLNSLVLTLEELLVCPIAPSKEANLVQLLPCGHCQFRFAWSAKPTYCDVCATIVQNTGPHWPAGRIGDVLTEIKRECLSYQHNLEHDTSPQRERVSLVRTTSEPAPTIKHRIDPSRLFKKPNLHRRGSHDSNDSERSLLRPSRDTLSLGKSTSSHLIVDYLSTHVGVGSRNATRVLRVTDTIYQATAISADCTKVAVVGIADFIVWEIRHLEPKIVCWGDMNGRNAPEPRPLQLQTTPENHYHLAAITDGVLAISQMDAIDIRNVNTGKRIEQLQVTEYPRTMVFSLKGIYLAIGTDSGDIFVYRRGLDGLYSAFPIRISRSVNTSVTSIVFSTDSTLMAACGRDNVVRVYRLSNLSIGCIQKYVEPLAYGKCRGDITYPHKCFKVADIADIDLYFPSFELLTSVFADHTHYLSRRRTKWRIQQSLKTSHRLVETSKWYLARTNSTSTIVLPAIRDRTY